MTVLLIALESDLHADAVVDHLAKLGADVVRIGPSNDGSLPVKIRITSSPRFETFYEFEGGLSLDPTGVDGIFCRFAIDSIVPSQEEKALQRFSAAERIAAFLAPLRFIEPSR